MSADEDLASTYTHAGFWRRLAAFLLDYIIVLAGLLLVGAVIGLSTEMSDADLDDADGVLQLIGLVASWLYWALQESSARRGTIGKRALGLVVTDEQGRPISFGRATGRFFGKILSSLILGIGYLMIAFTDRKQGLHDIIAKTLVLRQTGPDSEKPAVNIVERA